MTRDVPNEEIVAILAIPSVYGVTGPTRGRFELYDNTAGAQVQEFCALFPSGATSLPQEGYIDYQWYFTPAASGTRTYKIRWSRLNTSGRNVEARVFASTPCVFRLEKRSP